MHKVNMLEAKTHLSRLILDVADGEEVIIANRGKAVAKLVPVLHDSRSMGAALALWLTTHPPRSRTQRTAEEMEQEIAQERQAWE